MIHDIPELIEHISRYCTLHEGDIIFTGTPSGVDKILPGDEVKARLTDNSREGMQLLSIELNVQDRATSVTSDDVMNDYARELKLD